MPEATLSTIKSLMKNTDDFTDEQITAEISVKTAYVRRYCNRELADLTDADIEDEEYTEEAQRIFWITADGTEDYPWPVLKVIANLIYDEKRDNTVSSVRFADMQTAYATNGDISSSILKPLNEYQVLRVI